jgi:CRP-like cAMP-binding protein
MENFIEDLAQTKLFAGIGQGDIESLLACVGARLARYAKDEFIIEEGDAVRDFGVVLSGRARSIKWDASDKVFIIALLAKGSAIGVMLAASQGQRSTVAVQAQDDCAVLLIPFERVFARCEKACAHHSAMLRNLVGIVAEKGLMLHERIACLLKPTTREKILAFLTKASREQGGRTFSIPMDRNAMAEYLGVERCSLSRELSRMKRDGLIDYHKNSFRLTDG